MSKKQSDTSEQIRYRFTESGAEWAVTDSGHYRVLRCGDLVPGAQVRLRLPGLTHRRGYVQTLIPGWGPSPRMVLVMVVLDPPATRRSGEPKPVVRYYRPEHLTVIADDVRLSARGG